MDQTPDKLTSAKRPNTEDVTTRDHDADVQHAGQLREIREILERAKRLFKERRLAEARSEFILLIKLDTNNADGYYGLGILDLQSAENNFKCCTAVDPRNANAYYYLGLLSESRGDGRAADALYSRALSINGSHSAARRKLETRGTHSSHSSTSGSLPSSSGDAGVPSVPSRGATPGGVYELLRNDATPVARQAIDLIDASKISVRPRLTAYLGGFLRTSLLAVLPAGLVFGFLSAPHRSVGFPVVAFLSMLCVFSFAALMYHIARIRHTRITIDQGRIRIEKGILFRRTSNFELYRITDVQLKRSIVNRMTGDGTIVLFEKGPVLSLTGLAKIDRLENLFEQLRSLAFVMRTGPWGKGVIY